MLWHKYCLLIKILIFFLPRSAGPKKRDFAFLPTRRKIGAAPRRLELETWY